MPVLSPSLATVFAFTVAKCIRHVRCDEHAEEKVVAAEVVPLVLAVSPA